MRNLFKKYYRRLIGDLSKWSADNLVGLFLFNVILMILVLLHSAGYFAPYLPLTINFIMIFSIIMSIPLLKASSKAIFILAMFLWIFAGFLKILKIDIWAERTVIYTYEALVVGVILLIIESLNPKSTKPYSET